MEAQLIYSFSLLSMPFFINLVKPEVPRSLGVELKHQVPSQHLPFCHIHIIYFEQRPALLRSWMAKYGQFKGKYMQLKMSWSIYLHLSRFICKVFITMWVYRSKRCPEVPPNSALLLLPLKSSQAAAVYLLPSKAALAHIFPHRPLEACDSCVISPTGTCATWESQIISLWITCPLCITRWQPVPSAERQTFLGFPFLFKFYFLRWSLT